MSDTRRAFILKVARGAAYAAPLVMTLSTPEGLLGQGQNTNSAKGGMGQGNPCPPGFQQKGDECVAFPGNKPAGQTVQPGGNQAPWDISPPSSAPPGSGASSRPPGSDPLRR